MDVFLHQLLFSFYLKIRGVKRRHLLASVGGLLPAVTGCMGSGSPSDGATDTPTASPTPTAQPTQELTPYPTPAKPSNLDSETILDYVKEREHGVLYNQLHTVDATEISTNCDSVIDRQTEAGVYAFAGCEGYANYGDDAHADLGSLGAYFVTTDTTRRIGTDELERRDRPRSEVYAATDSAENVNPPEQATAGFRIYNFRPTRQPLSVEVTYLEAPDPEPVMTAEYSVPAVAGIWQDDVTVRKGDYRIQAQVGSDTTATHRWPVADTISYSWGTTVIYLEPGGGLSVHETSLREVVF